MSFAFMGGAVVVAVPVAIIGVAIAALVGFQAPAQDRSEHPRAPERLGAGHRVLRARPPDARLRVGSPHAAGPRRLLGLAVRQLARPALSGGPSQGTLARAVREVFDTVEVNSTFYRLASADAVARWVEQTPPGFVFAAKASRYMTTRCAFRTSRRASGATTRASSRSSSPASSARSSGSSPRTSSATTTGSAGRSRCFRPDATASSSGTRVGSWSRFTSSCVLTARHS